MELSLSNSYILTRVGSHEQRSMRVTSRVSSIYTGVKLKPITVKAMEQS